MSKIINQIRDIEIIENELKASVAGLLSLRLSNDNRLLIPSTYVYLDKNIYVFFEDESEIFDKINLNSTIVFSLIKEEKALPVAELDFVPVYKYLSVKLTGPAKFVEEAKTIEELNKIYSQKYVKSEEKTSYKKILMIDTEEIQASEETGG